MSLIRQHTDLPIAVGFGIKDGETAGTVAKCSDAVVVGSALVDRIADAAASGLEHDNVIQVGAKLISEIRSGVNLATSQQ